MSASLIRLALVGCSGNTSVYRDITTRLSHACFTVVAEKDAKLGRAVADAVGASVLVDSLETAVEQHNGEFDAVVIHVPHTQRSTVVELAAAARKHVHVDGPVSGSLQGAEETIEACAQAGVCVTIGQTLRFTPSSQTIMNHLSNGKLGDPGLLRVHRWRGMDNGPRPPLVDTLFGDVDLAMVLFDARPSDVYAIGRVGHDAAAAMDYIQVHFGFSSGGMAILDFSDTLPAGRGYESLSLIGSSGAAYADDHHNTHLLFRGGNPAALISDQGHGHRILEFQAFVDSIIEGGQPTVSGADCLAVHQVIDAIGRSIESGQSLHDRGGRYEPA